MAAGGPKSAAFAGTHGGGLITSVKDPEDTMERVIRPFQASLDARGKANAHIMATRWLVLAEHHDEAWQALGSMRGLRAPGRLEVVDPMILRQRADEMDRQEILGKYTVVEDPEQIVEAYTPLVTEIGADVVAIQIASVDPDATLRMLGDEVLPELRRRV